jgi:hypothetical protein
MPKDQAVRPLLLLACLALSGCVASNLAEVIQKMGDSKATVCVTVNTVYGTGKALRTNVATGKVKCDMDGMSVDTSASEAGSGDLKLPLRMAPHDVNVTPVK